MIRFGDENPRTLQSRPVRVFLARGTDLEIGAAHGEVLGEEAAQGIIRLFNDIWTRSFAAPLKSSAQRWLRRGFQEYLERVVVAGLKRGTPAFADERLRGLAEASSLSMDELTTALVLPDLAALLQAYLGKVMPGVYVPCQPPSFGCSSFVSSGKRFLFGRNLDFPGVGYWDRYPLIQVSARQGWLKTVGFGSSGIVAGIVTGVNAAQVAVAIHQHYAKSTRLGGMAPFLLVEEILGTCRSLQEGVEMIRQRRVNSSWAFVLADGKDRSACVVEATPEGCGVRYLSPSSSLTHSNFFQDPVCRQREYSASGRMNWDNHHRNARLQVALAEHGPGLQPSGAAQVISDHWDTYWEQDKVCNRTVSQIYNIQSLVLDPERMMVWMAEGVAPIHLRTYRGYDLGRAFAGEACSTGDEFPGYSFSDPSIPRAKTSYVESMVAALDGNEASAIELGERSLEEAFTPEVALSVGILKLKAQEYTRGLECLESATSWIEAKVKTMGKRLPPEYFEALVFQARANDLLGRREEARKIYSRIVDSPDLEDPHLARMASKAGKFKPDQLGRIQLPFSTYGPFL